MLRCWDEEMLRSCRHEQEITSEIYFLHVLGDMIGVLQFLTHPLRHRLEPLFFAVYEKELLRLLWSGMEPTDHVIGIPVSGSTPSLAEMFRSNPVAVLQHFWWNLSLTPSGIQILLFNASAGAVNPDYFSVQLRSLRALALSKRWHLVTLSFSS